MEDLIIRKAQPGDAAGIVEFFDRIGGESDNLSFGAEGLGITPESEAVFIDRISSDVHSAFFIAVRNGKVIGDVTLNGLPRRMSHRAELSIVVAKSEWGKGVGSLLMEKAISYAAENGIKLINLEVRSDNERAIRLYEKYGFLKTGVSPACFMIDGKYYDADIMVLDLR